jgi:succinate dehydrogenase / fumarate reductase cytochrome b subunit
MEQTSQSIPIPFIWRRLHSITGLFITLYLIEHLLVNSQAALFIGDDGWGFVKSVNNIHDLPYLPLIEFFLLGVPIAIHAIWGVVYLRTAKQNAYGNHGNTPYLPEYPRNKAYTWQRITSWILLVGIIAHVLHMRFIEYPTTVSKGPEKEYSVRLKNDEGLQSLSERLGFQIVHKSNDEVIGVTKSFGMAELLIVRETFKMPLMIALYTIFVLAAAFHGFNGLWTFMISWGVTLSEKSQKMMLRVAQFLMVSVAFLGLAAIWGTYWINLKF